MDRVTELPKHEANLISKNEAEMGIIIEQLNKVRQFKVNDYLICFRTYADTGQRVPITNSYGTQIKYKVVHVDKYGIPYVKEVSSKGSVRGVLKPLMGLDDNDSWGGVSYPTDFDFEHDPHFVESIILSAEETYDPTEVQRKKKNLRDEITKHNLEAKIKASEMVDLVAAFDTMSVGQTWWFSGKNGMTIDNVTIINSNNMHNLYKKHPRVKQINVTLSNGKKEQYMPHDFRHKNLYSKQPRSYKELSDSI